MTDLVSSEKVLYFDYTNWRGERSWRRVVPLPEPPEYLTGATLVLSGEVVHEEGWVLHVWDLDKKARRSYIFKNIHAVRTTPPEEATS